MWSKAVYSRSSLLSFVLETPKLQDSHAQWQWRFIKNFAHFLQTDNAQEYRTIPHPQITRHVKPDGLF